LPGASGASSTVVVYILSRSPEARTL